MLDPSSSEDESDRHPKHNYRQPNNVEARHQVVPAVHASVAAAPPQSQPSSHPFKAPQVTPHQQTPSQLTQRGGSVRAASPSPSLVSERNVDDGDRGEKGEEMRKKKLQLYVFVMRCVAYPFNAKQPTDMVKRPVKISKQLLATIKERFLSFIRGEFDMQADEAFKNAVQSYYETFLKNDRTSSMVKGGFCSAQDMRDIFKNNIEKRVRSLPEIAGLPKETVLGSWMGKFDQIIRGDEDPRKWSQRMGLGGTTTVTETVMTKEQLFDMIQNILGVKKHEHQIFYNTLQEKISR